MKHKVVLVCTHHNMKMYRERERGSKTSYILNLDVREDASGLPHAPFSPAPEKNSPTSLPTVQ
jgi:hypothetical protein